MNHSWADGGYDERRPGPGPSRGARVALTALIVLSTGLGAAWYAKVGMDQSRLACYQDRPPGVSTEDVTTTFRWLPPGYDCSYATDGTV